MCRWVEGSGLRIERPPARTNAEQAPTTCVLETAYMTAFATRPPMARAHRESQLTDRKFPFEDFLHAPAQQYILVLFPWRTRCIGAPITWRIPKPAHDGPPNLLILQELLPRPVDRTAGGERLRIVYKAQDVQA